MEKLYILGGKERNLGFKEATDQDEWCLYNTALILELNTVSGGVRTCIAYQTPREARAGEHAAAHFHSGALVGDLLYTCTTTEILTYRIPNFEQVGYLSLPFFNDVHHVTPSEDGNLLVVSTGLDAVFKVTSAGDALAEWSVVDENPWVRFSRTTDYRKVATTKPHRSHPNFVFELDGHVWVTRFHQCDALCLTQPSRRISMQVERPHDGLVSGDRIFFTGVDGKIVVVNRHTLKIDEIVDLRQIQDRGTEVLPAWCRGLLPLDQKRIWVGFTRIRKTIFQENVRWVKTVLREGTVVKPTHIALFDIEAKQCLQEFDLEPYGMNTVFGIFPVPS